MMKTIEWKKFFGALALLLSVGAQAAEPPGIKIAGEHLDYYINDPSPGTYALFGVSVSGDTLSFSGTGYSAFDSFSYIDVQSAPFYVTAHEGYTLSMSPTISFAGAQSGVSADSPSAGTGQLMLFTYVDEPSGATVSKASSWFSPYMQPGESVGQSGGQFSSSNFDDNGVRPTKLTVSTDLFLLVDAYTYVSVDSIRMTFNAVPLTPVPESETYAMLLGGLALIGAVARRQRRT